jgi:hypothetical protein
MGITTVCILEATKKQGKKKASWRASPRLKMSQGAGGMPPTVGGRGVGDMVEMGNLTPKCGDDRQHSEIQ